MAKTKLERIAEVEAEIRQLNEQKKKLKQQHNEEARKARNHRLCRRGGLVEKLLPEIIAFTDTQFDTFVEKTLLTSHTKRAIAEILAQPPCRKLTRRMKKRRSGRANPPRRKRRGRRRATAQPRLIPWVEI
jgi:hypothetical protein